MATYENAIPYIQKAEGGLSRATGDTASANPAPFTYLGQTGWHTNRGIQWSTFKDSASTVGYAPTAENFFNMPDKIWLGIYHKMFWDVVKGDSYNSQAVANAIVDWGWASGTGERGAKGALIRYLATKGIKADGYQTISNGFNELVKKEGEDKVFNDLIDERKRFFKSLGQPQNEHSWFSRMEALREQGMSMLGEGAKSLYKHKKVTIPILIAVVGLCGFLYYLNKTGKIKLFK